MFAKLKSGFLFWLETARLLQLALQMVINRKSLRARINGAIQGNSRDYCGSPEIVTRFQTKPAMRQQIQDANYVESDGGKLSRLGNRMFLKLTLPLLCVCVVMCYNIFTIYTEIKKKTVIKVSIASHLWWEFFSSFFKDTPRWRLLFFHFLNCTENFVVTH